MTDAEKLAKIATLVKSRHNPDAWVPAWYETGNYDDSFEQGQDVGATLLADSIGAILGLDLPEVKGHDPDFMGE
jgi:hypothetical protein